jgi:hypothetical protein
VWAELDLSEETSAAGSVPGARPNAPVELRAGRLGGDAGGDPQPTAGRLKGRYLMGLLVLGILIVGALVVPGVSGHQPAPTPTPVPQPTHSLSANFHQVTSINFLHPLLPVPPDFRLFARGPDFLLNIDLAQGRMIATQVPALDSSGPVSFLASQTGAVIWPQDAVTRYVVPDGRMPDAVSGSNHTGQILPGPDPRHLWTETASGRSMILTDLDGTATGSPVYVPVSSVTPDDRGYLVYRTVTGTYVTGPTTTNVGRLVTTGELLATGPTRWLVEECDAGRKTCSTVLIDRTTGVRRLIGVNRGYTGPGQISPDGQFAAIYRQETGERFSLYLLNLRTGKDQPTDVVALGAYDNQTPSLIWSPDGKWLFTTVAGQLTVLDQAGKTHRLGVFLPLVEQLASRPAITG